MDSILNYSIEELKSKMEPKYMATQIYKWIYEKFEFDFDKMTDISLINRNRLKENYTVINLKIIKILKDDEAIKFILQTDDSNVIETVLIIHDEDNEDEEDKRNTLCISSQIGCPLNCAFCATGKMGYKRDLFVSEIISQVLIVENYLKENTEKINKRQISNIVFMGMGEPLLNYDNVMKAIEILTYNKGYNIGERKITISTAGIIPGIKKLINENKNVRLAISLHSSIQEKRKNIMPIARKYAVNELLDVLRLYQENKERRITFEYILLPGINDNETDIIDLKRKLQGLKYNINIIIYNPIKDSYFKKPDSKDIKNLIAILKKHAMPFVIRRSKGASINAACGQLAGEYK